jgi:predicted amidohydrolase
MNLKPFDAGVFGNPTREARGRDQWRSALVERNDGVIINVAKKRTIPAHNAPRAFWLTGTESGRFRI